MTDIGYQQKMAFSFLEDLSAKFSQKYPPEELRKAKSHGLGGFSSIFNSLVVRPR